MKMAEWDWPEEPMDDDDEDSCLARTDCIEELLSDAPAGCIYCRLGELDEWDDD
jgi:hypothetical protein